MVKHAVMKNGEQTALTCDNRIQCIRKARLLSRAKVAEQCGANPSQLWKLEHGQTPLTLDWMRRIAKALDCLPAHLLLPADGGPPLAIGSYSGHAAKPDTPADPAPEPSPLTNGGDL